MKIKLIGIFILFFPTIQSRAQTLWRSELLGRPTDSSITVNVIFSDSAEVRIRYGITSGVYPYQTPWRIFADSIPAETVIHGLLPDTKYYYIIQ